MKNSLLAIIFSLSIASVFSQPVLNYQKKTQENQADRTMMLDILRAKMYEQYQQEFVYVVKHFKVSRNYAWLEGEAQRKDGKPVTFPDNGPWSCCMTTCLFKKSNGKWYIVESGSFGTDVWYEGVGNRNPDAPGVIFPSNYPYYTGY